MKRHTRSFVRVVKKAIGFPELGCEVGVLTGANSGCLLRAFPDLRLFMVDLYREHDEGGKKLSNTEKMLDALRAAAKATQFAAARRTFLITDSVSASKLVVDGSLDFVFVDADHSYGGVIGDLDAWIGKVRSGGIVGGHDYGGMGDRRGRFGVKRAVDEFAGRKGYNVENEPGLVWWFVK